jgi:hypothetical protein
MAKNQKMNIFILVVVNFFIRIKKVMAKNQKMNIFILVVVNFFIK